MLIKRDMVNAIRTPLKIGALIFVAIFQGLLTASVFGGVGAPNFSLNWADNLQIMQNLIGLAFLISTDVFMKLGFGQILQIPTRLPLYLREIQNHMYSASAYYLSICIASFLLTWFYPVILGFIVFYTLDLKAHSFANMLEFTFILWLMGLAGCYTGILFSTIFVTTDSGTQVLTVIFQAFNVGAGLYANLNRQHTNWFVYYIQFLSPPRYACELLMRRDLANNNPYITEAILDLIGYRWTAETCYWALIAYTVFVFMLGWLILRFKARKY